MERSIDGRFYLMTGLLSSGAVVTLVIAGIADLGFPSWVKGVVTGLLSLTAAGLSFYARHKGHGKKMAIYSMLHCMHLQQASAWKRARDAIMDGHSPSMDLIQELRSRSDAMLVHEQGHVRNDAVALECERAARAMATKYYESLNSKNNSATNEMEKRHELKQQGERL